MLKKLTWKTACDKKAAAATYILKKQEELLLLCGMPGGINKRTLSNSEFEVLWQ